MLGQPLVIYRLEPKMLSSLASRNFVPRLELKPGLNIVIGPNEAGKSTLRRFISFMAFGTTLPMFGSQDLEGSMGIDLGGLRGEFNRKSSGGPRSRQHEIRWMREADSITSSELSSIAKELQIGDVSSIFGGISERIFEDVFSIQIDDMISKSIDRDSDLSTKLYGAFLVGAGVDPRELIDEFTEKSNAIWPARSKKTANSLPVLAAQFETLLRQLRASQSESQVYVELESEKSECENRIIELQAGAVECKRRLEVCSRVERLVELRLEAHTLEESNLDFDSYPPLSAEQMIDVEELFFQFAQANAADRELHFEIETKLEALSLLGNAELFVERFDQLSTLTNGIASHELDQAELSRLSESLRGEITNTLALQRQLGINSSDPLTGEDARVVRQLAGGYQNTEAINDQIEQLQQARSGLVVYKQDVSLQYATKWKLLDRLSIPVRDLVCEPGVGAHYVALAENLDGLLERLKTTVALNEELASSRLKLGEARYLKTAPDSRAEFFVLSAVALGLLGFGVAIFTFSSLGSLMSVGIGLSMIILSLVLEVVAIQRHYKYGRANEEAVSFHSGIYDLKLRKFQESTKELSAIFGGTEDLGSMREYLSAISHVPEDLGLSAKTLADLEDKIIKLDREILSLENECEAIANSSIEISVGLGEEFAKPVFGNDVSGVIDQLIDTTSSVAKIRSIIDPLERRIDEFILRSLDLLRPLGSEVDERSSSNKIIEEIRISFEKARNGQALTYEIKQLRTRRDHLHFSELVAGVAQIANEFRIDSKESLDRYRVLRSGAESNRAHLMRLKLEEKGELDRILAHEYGAMLFGFLSDDFENKIDLESEKLSLNAELEETSRTILSLSEDVGRLSQSIEGRANDSSISEINQGLEAIKAEFALQLKSWLQNQQARAILDEAISSVSQTKSKRVTTIASDLIVQMTLGRYESVLYDANNSCLIDDLGISIPFSRLSRGTLDLVYLATRVALAKVTVANRNGISVVLPMIFDDVLANHDPIRTNAMIRAIVELALERQIIYFTCHPEIATNVTEISRELGAGSANIVRL